MTRRSLLRQGVMGMLLALASFACLAHKSSDAYFTLAQDGAEVTGRLDLALRDLDVALDLDQDGDGRITWGELRARHADIAAYVLGRLALRGDGAACPIRVTQHQMDAHSDGAYAVLQLAARCPSAPAGMEVDYRLLFDVDAQHRGLLNFTNGTQARSALFSTTSRVQVFGRADEGAWTTFAHFVADGVRHIVLGFDHVLFLAALLLPAVMVRRGRVWEPAMDVGSTARNVIGIVTAFTAAHSITLSLATLQLVSLPSRLVESAIAASVLLTAIDNLYPCLPRRRWLVAFAFGLLHGFGFASVLLDLALPARTLAWSLLGFNIGVELGQVAIVALLVPAAYLLRFRMGYRRGALVAGSLVIACLSLGWLVERALQLSFMPV